jgi:hypothetical protein
MGSESGDGAAQPIFRWPHFRCPRMAGLRCPPRGDRGRDRPVPAVAAEVLTRPSPQPSSLRIETPPPEVPAIELRILTQSSRLRSPPRTMSPRRVRQSAGLRRRGWVDVRVSQSLVRRALKLLDRLFKHLENEGVQVQIAARESSYYQGSKRYAYAIYRGEQVQITLTEKTTQRSNPAWSAEKRYSVESTSTIRLAGSLLRWMTSWTAGASILPGSGAMRKAILSRNTWKKLFPRSCGSSRRTFTCRTCSAHPPRPPAQAGGSCSNSRVQLTG